MAGIKRDKLDALFSEMIRERAGWKCERCRSPYKSWHGGLQCAHIFSRSRWATRHDPDNAVALCGGCHMYLDANPLNKYVWYVKRFGQPQFDRIRMASEMPSKRDRKLIEIFLLVKMAEIKKLKTQGVVTYGEKHVGRRSRDHQQTKRVVGNGSASSVQEPSGDGSGDGDVRGNTGAAA